MYAIKITTTSGDTMYRQSYGTLIADKSKVSFVHSLPTDSPYYPFYRKDMLKEHKQWKEVSFEEVTKEELESWGGSFFIQQ